MSKACLLANSCCYLPLRFTHCARSCSFWRAKWWMNYSWYSWFLLQANKHLCATGRPEPFHETSGRAPALGLLAFKTIFPAPATHCCCNLGPDLAQESDQESRHSRAPSSLGGRRDRKRDKDSGGLCEWWRNCMWFLWEQREFSVGLVCCVAHRKDPRWRMNHCIVKVSVLCRICTVFVAAIGST